MGEVIVSWQRGQQMRLSNVSTTKKPLTSFPLAFCPSIACKHLNSPKSYGKFTDKYLVCNTVAKESIHYICKMCNLRIFTSNKSFFLRTTRNWDVKSRLSISVRAHIAFKQILIFTHLEGGSIIWEYIFKASKSYILTLAIV